METSKRAILYVSKGECVMQNADARKVLTSPNESGFEHEDIMTR